MCIVCVCVCVCVCVGRTDRGGNEASRGEEYDVTECFRVTELTFETGKQVLFLCYFSD